MVIVTKSFCLLKKIMELITAITKPEQAVFIQKNRFGFNGLTMGAL
jgi:hypothetical protein